MSSCSRMWGEEEGHSRAEKSRSAKAQELFATTKFNEIRKKYHRRVEHSKIEITNFQFVTTSSLLFQSLPEIILDHIFQYVRPPYFQTEQATFKNEEKTNTKDGGSCSSMVVVYWTAAGNRHPEHRGQAGINNRRIFWKEAQKKREKRKKEAKKKRGKQSSNGKSNKEIIANVDQKETVVAAGNTNIDVVDVDVDVDVDINVENDKTIHSAHDFINYLYNLGTKIDLILLNPDTHLTRPCWKDFNHHVESYPGWSTKRVVATREEMKFFGHRTGNKYFTRILYTIPDIVEEEKKRKVAAAAAAAAVVAAAAKKKQKKIAAAAIEATIAAANATAARNQQEKKRNATTIISNDEEPIIKQRKTVTTLPNTDDTSRSTGEFFDIYYRDHQHHFVL
mmetsp:Transcript_12998/g.14236  ORF Transcript_12998/g.14236 Transcript_12998/m.14236 type:complete len:393 (+) Transcript_12998:133-1311(+)